MTDVKRLLEQATPLPWQVNETDGYLTDSLGELIHWDTEGLGATWAEDANPELIVYAVNRLPDYEAAVDALERLERLVSVEWDASTLVGMACTDAREALRRLREQVPA